jgi:G3E family GTPase
MEGYDRQFVVQGIHMLFNGELGPQWEDRDKRRSRLVFIGVRLPQRELRRGFEACVAKKKGDGNDRSKNSEDKKTK